MHDPQRPAPWTQSGRVEGKRALYRDLAEQLDALLSGETDTVANAANAAAAIFHSLPNLQQFSFCQTANS